ncbi:MAG: Panacea domain-containing protein [Ferruginibacter sp.]
MSASLTHQQINKIGNTLLYLAKNVGDLSKTKILKLLFLLEESSIKKFAVPFFGAGFQLWKFGPVIKDVYVDLSEQKLNLFKDFIKVDKYDSLLYQAIGEFNDDEFSDNDIFLLEKITEFARHKTAKNLVDFTHEETSLWRRSAAKYGILNALESGAINTSDYHIDFSLLFDDNDELKKYYQEVSDNRQFINSLKP